MYKPTNEVVIVTKAHYDDLPPFFTVTFKDGRERQTTSEKLESIEVQDLRDKERKDKQAQVIKASRRPCRVTECLPQAAELGANNPLLMHKKSKEFADAGRRKKRLKI